jgi:phage terminase large subunit
MSDNETFDDLFPKYELIMEGQNAIKNIHMPYHPMEGEEYIPRPYQEEFWDMFDTHTQEDYEKGFCDKEQIGLFKPDEFGNILKHRFKRMILAWHRRAGKDFDAWQRFLLIASAQRGIYYYMLPTASQAKLVIFEGQSSTGEKFIDFLPKELIVGGKWNQSEMKCELINGSKIVILGSDNYDRIVGSNPKGIVFSEYALCNPAAWTYMRPILKLNGGFAWFISTPRGRNHMYDLVQAGLKNVKDWIVSIKTIYDTGLMTKEGYQEELDGGMEESKAQQEYLVDFNAPVKGSYYSKQIIDIYQEERYKEFMINNSLPVKCAFDIGINDKTAIVFWQQEKTHFNIIGYYQNDSEGLEHYVVELNKFMTRNKVHISDVYFPHDIKVKEWGNNGKKRIQMAREALPDQNCHVLDKDSLAEGIDKTRRILTKCLFLQAKSKYGTKFLLDSLGSYHRQWNDKRQEYENVPVHDWASHPADAFRYFSQVASKELAKMNNRNKGAVRTGMRKGSVI